MVEEQIDANVRQHLYKTYSIVVHHPFILKVAFLAKLPRDVIIDRLIDSNMLCNQLYICPCNVHVQATVAIVTEKKINKIVIGIYVDLRL